MRRQNKSAQPKHMGRRVTAAALAVTMGASSLALAPFRAQAEAAEKNNKYEIFPNPHVMTYPGGDYVVKNEVNVVYEEGIDQYTKARLDEVLKLKQDIKATTSETIVEGKTNILVGIEGSKGYVDKYADEKGDITVTTQDLFNKTDSYVLDSKDGVITVLGKDTDAAFYGLTTLYHVFTQMDSYTIQNFHVEDWADVASRGFIEGYYGNPWSVEDRANLMRWSGYYKLNSYFYAPKDDPKHNAKWQELYTEQELKDLIDPLAKAGNESKCKFVYALHPYMHNPINAGNYDEHLAKLKAKFLQVIDHGVRQIAVLADDAGVPGGNNETGWAVQERLMKDLTDWVSSAEMQEKYSGLKVVIPFCPNDYMGNGNSAQLKHLGKHMPETVPLVVTGGRVWGEVSQNFTNGFKQGVGRGPYMWINWPCTDNSKKHLIMGGYDDFLQVGVDPANIEGIVLNPMQQSEPSKVAIFGNACYSWNIWENKDEADAAWNASFKYVDHNNGMETEASAALRELSKHMINQAMDSRVRVLQESVELKKILEPFKTKLADGTVTSDDVDKVMKEFVILQEAAKTYRDKAGDQNLKNQIVYWLDCWDDTTTAAIAYLNGVKAVLNGDSGNILKFNAEGKAAFDQSRNHPFWYLNHYEYAEVGVQHIVPFIQSLASYVSRYAETTMDPQKIVNTFVTNRKDNPNGNVNSVFDGKDDTGISYRSPAAIAKDEYVGVTFNKPIEIKDIRFLMGGGKNHFEKSKLQYTENGKDWKDIPFRGGAQNLFTGQLNKVLEVSVDASKLPENFRAQGIRLITTQANTVDCYLDLYEIVINKQPVKLDPTMGTYSSDHAKKNNTSWDVLKDGNNGNASNNEVWVSGPGDMLSANGYIEYKLPEGMEPTKLNAVHFAQGGSQANDVIDKGELQYKDPQTNEWKTIPNATVNNQKKQDFDLSAQNIVTTAVRVVNKQQKHIWWRVGEFRADFEGGKATKDYVYTNVENSSILSVKEDGKTALTKGQVNLAKGQYIGVDLKNIKSITAIVNSALPDNVVVETSTNGVTWSQYNPAAKADVEARYARVVNKGESQAALNLDKFEVSYSYVAPKSVKSNFSVGDAGNDMRNNGSVKNVFDGNLSTSGIITGFQKTNQNITFDLGQVIHFESLAYYIAETQMNYPRHAKFEVSVDGQSNWQQVLVVGSADFKNEWDETVAKDIDGKGLTHDSNNPGYMFAEKTGLNVDGRYIRVTPLGNYDHRWFAFNEIKINGGKYISPETNRDITSSVVEEPGKLPSNALDGNYNTTYRPSAKNGSFTYRVSAPEGLKSIRLVQLGAVSNATVTANYLGENAKAGSSEKLGTLNQAINEFMLPSDKKLESITVTWTDVIPEIAEIGTSTKDVTAANKTELDKALAAKQPTETWITDSVNAYNAAKAVAEEISKNTKATQTVVDSALAALKATVDSAVLKATNVDELKKLVDGKVSNEDNTYTTVSYYNYSTAVENLKNAISGENANNLSQEKANELKAAVETAQQALSFSTRSRELAELAIETAANFKSENYTTASYKALTDAKAKIEELAAQDKKADAERVNPAKFVEAKAAYEKAVEDLVDITALKAEIAKFDTVDGSLYTAESYNAYKAAVDAGKALLESGTKEAVAQAAADIQAKFGELKVKPDTDLADVIAQAKALKGENYTAASYKALMDLVAEAEASGDASYIEKLENAMKALVNVEALKAQYTAAQAVDAGKYTTASYKVLSDLMAQVDALLQAGTQQKVDQMTAQLDMAIRSLVVRATGVDEYRGGITLLPADGYTPESYKAYKDAYDALMAADAANLSASEFEQLKANFEKAKLNLKPVEAEKPGNGNGDNVQTGDSVNLVPYVLAVAVCAAGLGALVMVKSKKKD